MPPWTSPPNLWEARCQKRDTFKGTFRAYFESAYKLKEKKYLEDGLHTLCLKLAKYFDNVVNSPEKSKICV